jgi:hypothetical protein
MAYKTDLPNLAKTWRPDFALLYSKPADIYMADAVAMQPVRRPLRVVRIKNEDGSVASVQHIMQGPA